MYEHERSLGVHPSWQYAECATWLAECAMARGEVAPVARMLLSPLTRFLKFWLVRGGWQDGVPGFVHIAIGCQNSFMKYVKLRELRRQAGLSEAS
jgi:hypothetical protein